MHESNVRPSNISLLSTHGDVVVPRALTTRFGSRSFRIAGHSTWNGLPSNIRSASTREQFERSLKSCLFECASEILLYEDAPYKFAFYYYYYYYYYMPIGYCLCVFTVTDFSAKNKASGVKFCTTVH